MDGWTDGWMDGLVNGWMDGNLEVVFSDGEFMFEVLPLLLPSFHLIHPPA